LPSSSSAGAFFAHDAGGGRYVFKYLDRGDEPADHQPLADMVARLSVLRDRGYPMPRYWPPFDVEEGTVVVQEAVGGVCRDDLSDGLVDTILDLNALQAGDALEDRTWNDYLAMTLVQGANGYCLHESLRTHGRVTRRIVEWVESVGRGMGPLPGGDLVHFDFHHRNLLREGDRLVAVIDWEGSRPGDRAFDLVTFCFGFTHARVTRAGLEHRVWERACALAGPDALAAYVAHMALRRLDWSIRHHPDEVEALIHLVDRYMDLVD
jgi:aminoglycoside phosphotransferase (APT) family kinase protein